MNSLNEPELQLTRRQLFGLSAKGIGLAALSALLQQDGYATQEPNARDAKTGGLVGVPHHTPKIKRIIYLHQSGGPSQLDTFDYKPALEKLHGTELPDSVRNGQRITGMTSGQSTFPCAKSIFQFKQHGQSGAWVSELLPHTAKLADDLTIIKTMNTDAINHDPAITFIQTGFQQPGRPSMGAWVSYGLGSENQSLPAYIVLLSTAHALNTDQPLFSRLWSSGFLPSSYQGVRLRGGATPVLYLDDPPGVDKKTRRQMLDAVAKLNKLKHDEYGDPEIETRIAQYEMAYRMQTSVPDLMDLSKEPDSVFEMYGPEARRPGTYAANCLLARRLAERGVRFIQLYHRGWDQHNDLPRDLALQCGGTDQPTAALVQDLKQRGLLDDTLVVWGGEFGRTVYCQGKLTEANYGRDHHPRNFCMWLAGGGLKKGLVLGETDDFSYNVVSDPVSVFDLQATMLHLLGIDHKRLTYKFQGRHFRLTDVHGELVEKILA
ncbi:MAG: DUF1501 domain-containing protein [Acidobacteria bacterium]|nr:DUF1501 domain-containing protein [Acidobacteriota bacterium]MBI3425237.1 DUF1501 domain-containing protein [Acidobacteriota bacterium]